MCMGMGFPKGMGILWNPMGMEIKHGIGDGTGGNGNSTLRNESKSWEWDGREWELNRWEWEEIGMLKAIPAHL